MPLTNAEVDAAVPFGAGEQPDRQLTNAALKELIVDIAAKDVATDAIWDAAGDLAVGSGANAAARLAKGTDGQVLGVVGGAVQWTTVAGGGDVTKVGTPVNDQMPVWTGDGTLEGTSDFTYDGTSLNLITGKNLQIAGGTVLSDAAGTLTLSGIDALDATTEATIESSIDTLANLTTIQGRTVTLADAGADALFGWDDSASAYQNLSAADARTALELTSLATLTPASGIAAWLADPTSANLRAAVTDESGDSVLMFEYAPVTLTTSTNLVRSAHGNRQLICDSASPITLTIEDDTTGGWVGTDWAQIINIGAGLVTLDDDGTAVLNAVPGYALTVPQFGIGGIQRYDTNEWTGYGQLSSSGGVATDAIWDASGDLVQGTGANTAARLAIGTALQVLQVNAGATAVEWGAVTGSGSSVRATSPTLVTPALGTPSALVLTNATGLPVAGGGTGVASLTAFAPVFGGTTSTGAVQSGTAGTAGQVLTSNGAGVLPTFQAVPAATVEGLPRGITNHNYAYVQNAATALTVLPAGTSVALVGTVASTLGLFNTNYNVERGTLTSDSVTVNSGIATVRGQANAGVMAPAALDIVRVVWEGVFFPCDAGTGRRSISGMFASVALTASADPDAIVNVCGFGKRAADSNLQLITNDGSGTGTSTDMGANFPAANTTDYYYGRLELRGGATRTLFYYLKNMVTGNETSGSVTATLPDAGTMLTYLDSVMVGPTTATTATKPFSYGGVYAYQVDVNP